MVRNIYPDFYHNPSLEVRGIFWISQKRLIKYGTKNCKLGSLGISRNQNLFRSFLSDRHQRVVLNGQRSHWASILAEIPQGSILGEFEKWCAIRPSVGDVGGVLAWVAC